MIAHAQLVKLKDSIKNGVKKNGELKKMKKKNNNVSFFDVFLYKDAAKRLTNKNQKTKKKILKITTKINETLLKEHNLAPHEAITVVSTLLVWYIIGVKTIMKLQDKSKKKNRFWGGEKK